jgi:hypothetical protein
MDTPTIQQDLTVEQFSYNTQTEVTTSELVSQSTQEFVPPYWIIVTQQATPAITERYMTLNDDEQAREDITQAALESVTSALSPISPTGSTGETHWKLADTKTDIVKFGTNNANIYHVRHKIFQLDVYDQPTNREYWQVESWVDSYIGTYQSAYTHCGPYLDSRKVYVSTGSNIYNYGPGTTVESGTATISIGFDVNTGGVGVGIGYSESWSLDGVRFDVSRGTNWLQWTEGFRGPNYNWWPWYREPCSAAFGGYPTTTRVLFDPPVRNGLRNIYLTDTFTLIDDVDLIPVGIFLVGTRNTYQYSFPWNNLQYSSRF